MAQTNVSNGVLTIIASFSNGLDVLKKLRRADKRKPTSTTTTAKWSRSRNQSDEDALRLSRSLRRGADDLGREYQARSMRCDGERYAIGDATAQNSLAEILIKLNTGLVNIITSFLSHDPKKQNRHSIDVDYRSLIDLSEHSREQSISVLRALYQRVMLAMNPSRRPNASGLHLQDPDSRNGKKTRSKKKRGGGGGGGTHASSKHTKIRHPTLARVVIENSSIPSQIALVRPSENSSKKQTPSRSPSHAPTTPQTESRATSPPPPPYFPSDPLPKQQQQQQQQTSISQENPATRPPRHHPSSTSLLSKLPPQTNPSPNPKPKHKPSTLLSPQPRPTTLYSLSSARTGSTKLGEIPMHKWATPWDASAAEEANRRALEAGWPLVGAGGGGEKKRGGWRRWFGR
ncbi:hypothetical protein Q7P37_008524 [Cladosporium fusiforme]